MAYNLYYIVKSLILKFHEELLQLVNHCSCLGQLALSRFQLTRRLLSLGARPQHSAGGGRAGRDSARVEQDTNNLNATIDRKPFVKFSKSVILQYTGLLKG